MLKVSTKLLNLGVSRLSTRSATTLFSPSGGPSPPGPQPFEMTAGNFSGFFGYFTPALGVPDYIGSINQEPLPDFALVCFYQQEVGNIQVWFAGDCTDLVDVPIFIDGESMFITGPNYFPDENQTRLRLSSETLVLVDGLTYEITFG